MHVGGDDRAFQGRIGHVPLSPGGAQFDFDLQRHGLAFELGPATCRQLHGLRGRAAGRQLEVLYVQQLLPLIRQQGGRHIQSQQPLAGNIDLGLEAHGTSLQVEITGLEAAQLDNGGGVAPGALQHQPGIIHFERRHVEGQWNGQDPGGTGGAAALAAALRVVGVQLRIAEGAGVHLVFRRGGRDLVLQPRQFQPFDGDFARQQGKQLQTQLQRAHPHGRLPFLGHGQADILQGYANPGEQPQADIAADGQGGAGLLPQHCRGQVDDFVLVHQQRQHQQSDDRQCHGGDDDKGASTFHIVACASR